MQTFQPRASTPCFNPGVGANEYSNFEFSRRLTKPNALLNPEQAFRDPGFVERFVVDFYPRDYWPSFFSGVY